MMDVDCAFLDCSCLPGHALYTFGGATVDTQLYFCEKSFLVLKPLYTTYKSLESDLHLGHFCYCPEGRMPTRNDDVPQFLIDRYECVTRIIALRKRFQALLRRNIVSTGHNFWLSRLKTYRQSLRVTIDCYFDLWETPKSSRGSKKSPKNFFFYCE